MVLDKGGPKQQFLVFDLFMRPSSWASEGEGKWDKGLTESATFTLPIAFPLKKVFLPLPSLFKECFPIP
jgi:hypothetical protein